MFIVNTILETQIYFDYLFIYLSILIMPPHSIWTSSARGQIEATALGS